jgi:hypothetical protein
MYTTNLLTHTDSLYTVNHRVSEISVFNTKGRNHT